MLGCGVLWSVGGIFIKLIPWNAFVLAGFRSLITGIVLFMYMKSKGVKLTFSPRTAILAAALSGTYLLFVLATKLTTAANAIVLQYGAPVFVLLYSAVVRKQKFRLADYGVVLFTFLGIGVCFLNQLGGGSLVGNLVALLSSLTFAAIFLASEGITPQVRLNGLLQGQLLTALIGIPFMTVYQTPFTVSSVGFILVLGVLQLGLASILYDYALARVSPLVCVLLAVVEPLLNPVWVALFYGEMPGALSIVGGLLVLATVTVWCVYDEKHKQVDVDEAAATCLM